MLLVSQGFMGLSGNSPVSEKWFSFGDSCVCVSEREPAPSGKGILVFLHGRLGYSEIWHPVVESLHSQFRCLFVDFPGHGGSFSTSGGISVTDMGYLVGELLTQLTADEAVLIGHDIGGAAAQFCAMKWPERVAGLVLINSVCLSERVDPIPCGWPQFKLRRLFKKLLHSSAQLTPPYVSLLKQMFENRVGSVAITQAIRHIQDAWPDEGERAVYREAICQLRKPTLLLWGGLDSLVPPERGFELIRRLPDASFYLSEHAGHWPFLENPDWVVVKTREFLTRLRFGAHKHSARFAEHGY